MPFIKDAKTGLPGYVIPDTVEEEPKQETHMSRLEQAKLSPTDPYFKQADEAAQDQSPDPSIYGEPGVTAAEVREKQADDPDMDYATRQPRYPVPDPDFDEVERRVNAPGTMTQDEVEQYARANALATAVQYGGFQTPEAAVRRASVYAAYVKDGTVPPADGLPPPVTPPSTAG